MNVNTRVLALIERYAGNAYELHNSAKGRQAKLRCPFHKQGQETHPSFYWNVDNGLFFCHSCKISGGIPTFLKLIGMSPEQIDQLVKDTDFDSIKILHNPFRRRKQRSVLASNPVLPEGLLGLFNFTPTKLVRAGFDPELLERYEIGYDTQNARIIFPIRDVFGRLIGVSGRADSNLATLRYKLYDDHELGDICPGYKLEKGHTLWNVHRLWARYMTGYDTCGWDPVIVLVEGFKAALYLLQIGFTEVIALMGSTMTAVQRFILSSLGGDVFVFLDNDSAGRVGAQKIVRELNKHSPCRPHLVIYPDGTEGAQPDSLEPTTIEQMIKDASMAKLDFSKINQKALTAARKASRDLVKKAAETRGKTGVKGGFWDNEIRIQAPKKDGNVVTEPPTEIIRLLPGEYPVPPTAEQVSGGSYSGVLPFYVQSEFYHPNRGQRGTQVPDTRDWYDGKDLSIHLMEQGDDTINNRITAYHSILHLGHWHRIKVEKTIKDRDTGKDKTINVEAWERCTGAKCEQCKAGVPRETGRPGYIALSTNIQRDLMDLENKFSMFCRCGSTMPLQVLHASCGHCDAILLEVELDDTTGEPDRAITANDIGQLYDTLAACPVCETPFEEVPTSDESTQIVEKLVCMNCGDPQRACMYDVDLALRKSGLGPQVKLELDEAVFSTYQRGFRVRTQLPDELLEKAVLYDFAEGLKNSLAGIAKRLGIRDEDNPFAGQDGYQPRRTPKRRY